MIFRATALNIRSIANWIHFPESRSPRVASIAAVGAVLLWGLDGGSPAAGLNYDQGSPAAVVDQATHDFGEVYEGEHISHTFTIRNTGAAALEIRDPAVKAQNESGDRHGFVVAAPRREGRSAIPGLGAGSEIASMRHAFEAGAGLGEPLGAAGGRPAAPS